MADAGCSGGMEMKRREGCKTSDVKRRGGGQMREGSSRAGKGCEAKERANRGPCFTNCHLRGANRGMMVGEGGGRGVQQLQTGSRLHTARDGVRTLHHGHVGRHTHKHTHTGKEEAQM